MVRVFSKQKCRAVHKIKRDETWNFPLRMVCRDFILTETANRVLFRASLNLRNLFYLIMICHGLGSV